MQKDPTLLLVSLLRAALEAPPVPDGQNLGAPHGSEGPSVQVPCAM